MLQPSSKKFLMLKLSFLCSHSSLFLTPEEKSYSAILYHHKKPVSSLTLKLNGIYYRPDVNQWVIWINNIKIDNRSPKGIGPWRIINVTSESVTLRSISGESRVLFISDS